MEKIDRLGWVAGMSFISYGVRFGLRVNRPEALHELLAYLPGDWQPARSPVVERMYSLLIGGPGPRPNVRRFHLLYGNAERLARTLEFAALCEALETDLQLYVAAAARRRVFVHAGVVGWHGQAIVIPGRSFSGKSTLVAALVRAGATYYSDEYAVVDAQGRVHPYPKPLSLRDNGTTQGKKYAVEELGGRSGRKPLPVGLVVVSVYKAGARWRPRRLSPGQGELALLAHTVSARRQPETVLATLQQVVSHAPVLKGTRGEATEMVEAILQHVCIAPSRRS
jgi:hypothetical protein